MKSVEQLSKDWLDEAYAYVRRLTRKFGFDESTSLDVTQEIIIKLYEKQKTFRREARLKTWVYSVARNHCINYKRRIYDKMPLLIDFNDSPLPATASDDPGGRFQSAELKDALAFGLTELPEYLKQSLLCFYYREMKYGDIARLLDVPEGTVKSRINKAKRLLRNRLRKYVE